MGFFSRSSNASKSGDGDNEASGQKPKLNLFQRVLSRVGRQAVENELMRQEASAAQAAADKEFFSRTIGPPPSGNFADPHWFRKRPNSSDAGYGTAKGPWEDRRPTTPSQGANTSLSSELRHPSNAGSAGLGPSRGRTNPPASEKSDGGDSHPNDAFFGHSSRSALNTRRSLSIGDEGDGQGKPPSSDAQTGEGHGSEPLGRSQSAGGKFGDYFGAEPRTSSESSSAHSSSGGSQHDFVRGWGRKR